MAELILYMGESGCGKSTALRTLPADKTVIIKPNSKSLPFPGGDSKYVKGKNLVVTSELDTLSSAITHINDNLKGVRYVVIEDFTHFFSSRIFSPTFLARSTGGDAFQRWNDFGASVFNSIFAKAQGWRQDMYIVVIHHTELKDNGTVGFKTAGKLLDNTIDVPSYFTYTFHGFVKTTDSSREYLMLTNKDHRDAKTPYGLFELFIPNDMKAVLDRIDDYKAGKIKIDFK